ncbi:glycosyltransferase family protein [Pedobacter frigiditerrae]|uniref:glycosyltransferase family protein n=1 Tax=Pedobacter frigiditerrae TaxID=2530452 RepID=UPI002930584D|nr:glycosyltransferase family protein [Pedobacter frigiditerrae]
MKILYAIQGTGNGHVSRAREIVPLLQKHGDLDILISGTQADVKLAQEVKFQLHGFSFIFGKKGGVDHFKTWKNMNLFRFKKDMSAVPLKDYNLIINDFEPVTAWACKSQGIESVSLSHQASFKSKKVPRPRTIDWGKLILSRYAPTTHHIGFHFERYDDFIYTPVIRSEIRELVNTNLGHYTVYLPAIDDRDLVKLLKLIPSVRWEVFSKHTKTGYNDGNVFVEPVNNIKFNQSMASSAGLFTGGGFEGPAEALFLGKKLLVAPMRFQYEQQCNAYALKELGLPVIWGSNRNWLPILKDFVANTQSHQFNFPDETAEIVANVVSKYAK